MTTIVPDSAGKKARSARTGNGDPSDDLASFQDPHVTGSAAFASSGAALYDRHLLFDNVLDATAIGSRERFDAFARSIRDVLSQQWVRTQQTYDRVNPKRIYYLSMEFLIGRSLANNAVNLLLSPFVRKFAHNKGINWTDLLEEEPDAGLGNGGLGRLAACFLDSMATQQLPAMGHGLRYEYGIFRQTIQNGWQCEQPDHWLANPDPWEVMRPHETVQIKLNCSFALRDGALRLIPGVPSTLIGIPFDRPVVGYGGNTINTLRLWSAATADVFDFQRFSRGDFVGALAESLAADSITRVLYPDDSTARGQGLRFVQEYFLVACAVADIVRRFQNSGTPPTELSKKVAIQLNDTHPALAVPELLRVLLDESHLPWDQAWNIVTSTLAYTNHTLLPEALEKWPVAWFELLLPRHLELIYEINRRLMNKVAERYLADSDRARKMSIIEEGDNRKVRMANLAIVGAHSVNGVAEIHSELLRSQTVREFSEFLPERFNNKTNGITQRRWLLLANPALAAAISHAIGDGWITDAVQLQRLRPLADNAPFRAEFRRAKAAAKSEFATWLKRTSALTVDPESIFDCQVKRIHEYKRQLLNALRIVVLFNRLRANPSLSMPSRTFFFAGKAAPAYHLAKVIIKFIHSLGETIAADPSTRGRINVMFLPDYRVSLAERLIPASDVSTQISTAGYEASGTSNMKFMMNGALTLGTRDGATIEMADRAGDENLFLFGLTADQVASSRSWYRPQWHYDNEPEIRGALDLISSGHLSRGDRSVFAPIRDTLLTHGDFYMHLADLSSFLKADRALCDAYADPEAWSRKAILNIAASGYFSSDRTISQYASEIWNVIPCPVSQ